MFQVGRHEDKPLTWWYENRDHIDFDPVYQRLGGQWGPKVKAFLIDSIINGYDIPKIYMADFTRADSPLNVKRKRYAIIDGKQRFEAVRDFLEDKLTLAPDFVYYKDRSLKLGGMTYSQLRQLYPSVAREVDQFQLDVVSVVTDERGRIEDLFVRLNVAVPLSGAEVRNAMPGIVPILARKLGGHVFFGKRIRFGTKRYQQRDAATKLLMIEYYDKLMSTKKKELDAFTALVEVEQGPKVAPFRATAAAVTTVLDVMAGIFRDRDPLLAAQGAVPLYYWLIREHGRASGPWIRPFLEEFDGQVRAAKANDKPGSPQDTAKQQQDVDEELLHFSQDRRSFNDVGALRRMYTVLDKRLGAFLTRHPQAPVGPGKRRQAAKPKEKAKA